MTNYKVNKIIDILKIHRRSNKVAISYKNEEISYRDLYSIVENHGSILSFYNCNRNIGIFINNSINYAIAYFVVAYLNRVIIPIENTIKKDTIMSIVNYCEISLLFTDNENYLQLKNLLREIPYKIDVYNLDTHTHEVINQHSSYIIQGEDDETDVAIMLHTSGTISNPKRVMLTNKNLLTNIVSNIQVLNINENDVSLIVLPMFFGYCNSSQFLSHLYVGASLIIYDSFFLPRRFLEIIDERKCTNTTCVPSMLSLIISSCRREDFSLDSLRYICFGGGKTPKDIIEKAIDYFDKSGVIQTYGQTEASPRITCLLPEDAREKIGSVGKPIPNVQLKIVNEDFKEVPNGHIGEIIVKGENVMKGYYKNPMITKKTIVGGWLKTGDLGRFDSDGYLYIVGRIKNVIISGGLNIYPEEIEEVLLQHHKIKEVMVFGESHNILTEVPSARVVLMDGEKSSAKEIIDFCLTKLPTNKVPSKIYFCDELKKTYTGKISRR